MVGNPQYYKACGTLFTCGSAMDVDTDAEKGTKPNLDLAKQLLKESGYDGKPVVILQPTDIPVLNNAALVTAQTLRSIGMNVELAASDWGAVVTRRAVKKPVAEGGWNIFITWAGGNSVASPIALAAHAATGDKAWFGWPTNARQEELRNEWAAAPTLAGAPRSGQEAAGQRVRVRAARADRPVGLARGLSRPGQGPAARAGSAAVLEHRTLS